MYEQNAQSRTGPDGYHFGARFNMMAAFDERADLVAAYLLVLAILGQEGKEKQDGNVDFGFVKSLKNAKSLERNIRLCKSFDWVTENFTSDRNFEINFADLGVV